MSTPAPKKDLTPEPNGQSRFSLHRLSEAFARLTASPHAQAGSPANAPQEVARGLDEVEASTRESQPLRMVLSPRMIVEAMLFVGQPDGQPLTNRAMAAQIRDVSPREIDSIVEELNAGLAHSGCCYRVASVGAGYQLQLCAEYEAVRHRMQGRDKQVRLSHQAVEVLSIVAYRQPMTADEVSNTRGSHSNAVLSQLVRRGLLRLERQAQANKTPVYHTTQRFNQLLGIRSPEELPQSEDLDDN